MTYQQTINRHYNHGKTLPLPRLRNKLKRLTHKQRLVRSALQHRIGDLPKLYKLIRINLAISGTQRAYRERLRVLDMADMPITTGARLHDHSQRKAHHDSTGVVPLVDVYEANE